MRKFKTPAADPSAVSELLFQQVRVMPTLYCLPPRPRFGHKKYQRRKRKRGWG